jgi:hypothetical protein
MQTLNTILMMDILLIFLQLPKTFQMLQYNILAYKIYLNEDLIPPNTLPREESAVMRYKDVIERSNAKHPYLGSGPQFF